MTHREPVLDNARALGIVAVVLGHTMGLQDTAQHLIYAVHMPLFFMMAGWLLRPATWDSLGTYGARQGRALGVPLVIFFAGGYVYWLATRGMGARAEKFAGMAWHEPLWGLATSRYDDLAAVNGPLWFLAALFLATFAFACLHRLAGPSRAVVAAVAIAGLVAVGWTGSEAARPWFSLDVAALALGFVAVGFSAGQADRRHSVLQRLSATQAALAGTALLIVFGYGALHRGAVDMAGWRLGGEPLGFAVVALLGTAGVLLLSRALPPSRTALWLSHHSLVIFATHVIVLNFTSGLAQISLGLDAQAVRTPSFAIVSSVVALLAAWPIGAVLRRALPSVFKPMPSVAVPAPPSPGQTTAAAGTAPQA